MANKYLKRRFTNREIILLIVLVVVLLVGLYFALVYYPLSNRNAELDEQLADIDSDLAIAQALKANYDLQKAAVEQYKQSQTAKMPRCTDEQQKVLANHFFTVFGSNNFANINWSNPTAPSEGVSERRVTVTFTVTEANLTGAAGETVFDRTITMLNGLLNSGFRCAMTNVSLSGGSDLSAATSISVVATIRFTN